MTNTLTTPLLSTSYLNATGPIRYGMTNDCMFRTVLQRNNYVFVNTKTHDIYSDKFILRVVNLKQIDLATEDDCANHIDYWARLFTATSWEDIKMIAQNDSFLSAASQSLYESNADEIVRQKCRAREEYYKREHAIKKLADEVASLQQQLAQAIAEKNSAIAEKDSIIDSLKAELAKEPQ